MVKKADLRLAALIMSLAKLPRKRMDIGALVRGAAAWEIKPSPSTVSDFLVLDFKTDSLCGFFGEELAHEGTWEKVNALASEAFGRPLTILAQVIPPEDTDDDPWFVCWECEAHIPTPNSLYAAMLNHFLAKPNYCTNPRGGMEGLLTMLRDEMRFREEEGWFE